MLDNLPEDLKLLMDDIMFAKLYNTAVGANVTHREVSEWGINERESILAAIDLM